jgi:hypothetical protein
MRHCATRIGDAYFRTPRETVKGFLDLLALLDQHPEIGWQALLNQVDLTPLEPEPDHSENDSADLGSADLGSADTDIARARSDRDETSVDDELHTFRL